MLKVAIALGLKNYQLMKEFSFNDTTFRIFQSDGGRICLTTESPTHGIADVTRQDIEFSSVLKTATTYLQENFNKNPDNLTKLFVDFLLKNESKFISHSLVNYFDKENSISSYEEKGFNPDLFLDLDGKIDYFKSMTNFNTVNVRYNKEEDANFPSMFNHKIYLTPNYSGELFDSYGYEISYSGNNSKSLKIKIKHEQDGV